MDSSAFRFPADAPPDDIEAAMRAHGCAIVERVLPPEDVAALKSQAAPLIGLARGDAVNGFNGEFTVRFGRTMWLLPKARDVVRHPLVVEQLDRCLLRSSPAYNLTFDGIMHVMAGQKEQVLHRDNTPFTNTPTTPPVLFATLWAVEEFRRDNGGTVFAPGSHLWEGGREPLPSELCCAEMPAGSVLLYYGNLLHGAGASVVGTRTALSLQYAVSWLRQEEDQWASVPHDVLATFDDELLGILGIAPVARNWGTVSGKHPIEFLRGDGRYRSLDVPGNSFANGRCRKLYFEHGEVETDSGHFHVRLKE